MISQDRYVNIVSGVGAGSAVAQRQLIMRLITQNTLIPPGIVMEFGSSDSVSNFFGSNSEEAKRAKAYFSFISKSATSPETISFARWVSAQIAPMVVGDMELKSLSALSAISTGTLSLLVGAAEVNISAVDLSGSESLTAIAAEIQTTLRATVNAQLATCTVTYNTNTNQFVLTGSVTGSGTITVTPTGLSTDLSALLGWGTSGTVYVTGQGADDPADAVSKSAEISNNFGSFVFCTPSVALTNSDIGEIASWNHAQNAMYIYSVATPITNLGALYAITKGFSGCALNVSATGLLNDYVEQCPCEILGATNYASTNATQSFMFYQFPTRNVSVNSNSSADTADASRGNYNGATQSVGQSLAFYQRGILCGGSTAATDMNTYANEMWFKSAIANAILRLFLGANKVPANQTGAAMILGALQQIIAQGKDNGTISTGKTLTQTQQQYITQISGDSNAWRQVSSIGYWLSVVFSSFDTTDGRTEWKADYTLIYSKDDTLRKVNGSNVLI